MKSTLLPAKCQFLSLRVVSLFNECFLGWIKKSSTLAIRNLAGIKLFSLYVSNIVEGNFWRGEGNYAFTARLNDGARQFCSAITSSYNVGQHIRGDSQTQG